MGIQKELETHGDTAGTRDTWGYSSSRPARVAPSSHQARVCLALPTVRWTYLPCCSWKLTRRCPTAASSTRGPYAHTASTAAGSLRHTSSRRCQAAGAGGGEAGGAGAGAGGRAGWCGSSPHRPDTAALAHATAGWHPVGKSRRGGGGGSSCSTRIVPRQSAGSST